MPFDGTQLSQTKRDLLAARELLLTNGWQPQAANHMGDAHCPVTALMEVQGWQQVNLWTLMAIPWSPRFRRAYRELVRQLPETVEWAPIMKVPSFNVALNEPSEAIALFDRAIAHAE
jgi:hypothetical protein